MRIATRLSAFLLLALTALAFGAPAASEYRLAAPAAPTNVQATQGSYTNKIRITWNSASGANSYRVYRSMSYNGPWTVYIATPSGTTYDDYFSNAGYKYYYRISSCTYSSGASCGAMSYPPATGWVKPEAPSYISATDGAYTSKVRISWGAVDDATAYKLYRGTDTDGYNSGPITIGGATYWDELNIVPGRTYYWWVRAYNSATNSTSSFKGPNSGYRQLAAPTGFVATDGIYCDKTKLVWNYAEGATSYTITRGDSPSSHNQTWSVGQTTQEFYDYSGNASQVYYYWVKACSTDTGCGPSTLYNDGFRGVPPRPRRHHGHRWRICQPREHPLGRTHGRHLLSALPRHQPQFHRHAGGLYPGYQL